MASVHMGAALRQIHGLFEAGTVAGLDRRPAPGSLPHPSRDESAFAALVVRHGPMVLGVCRAVLNDSPEVEDAFQATFLVLIRKAGTIRGRDAVGGWLHRVAHRVAVQAGLDRSRKDRRERGAGDLSALAAVAERPRGRRLARLRCTRSSRGCRSDSACRSCSATWKARRTHRRPSSCAGARRPLRRRLADARDLLRSRLTRRGVAVSSGALAAALASPGDRPRSRPAGSMPWPASPPARSPPVRGLDAAARLAETLVRGMLVGQIQSLATVVAHARRGESGRPAPGPGTGLRSAARRWPRSRRPLRGRPVVADRHGTRARATQTMRPSRSDLLTVSGRVLDPDGKPFAGAKVYSYRPNPAGVTTSSPPARRHRTRSATPTDASEFQIADPGFLTLQDAGDLEPPDRRGPGPRIRTGLGLVHHGRRGQGPDAQAGPG